LKPDDCMGAYTAREILVGWLNNETLIGMTGEWDHSSNIEEEQENVETIKEWLKG